ncbi:hypothetical protein L2E82_24773 [Cichorium intybus]|uniref:Uncharacterized protein n=1 Tax=Cichorium intybus TaxID=13427 RepID=A0ACB9E1T2_CICIN|nr:hypothetical protein L2E82_24773 [Cichorium intybus]
MQRASTVGGKVCKSWIMDAFIIYNSVLDEEGNDVSVTDLTALEEELTAALIHTRSRKTEMMMERLSALREQEKKLNEENEQLKQQY